ncbi:MAG: hypothetical protein HZB25_07850 [Candidatus Eisenbacteria bacterium]|nr:hypothetical protein [Candidatus Eisenbacteria bacterium]
MARRASFIDSTTALTSNLLLLDGGNLFETNEAFQLERGLFLMRMMARMGYHAIGVGEKDLAYGVQMYKDSALALGLLPVSANLVDRGTHKLLFQPYSIETVSGIKVGVFSVLSPQNGYTPSPISGKKDSLEYLDVEPTVRRMVNELRPKVQVLVGMLNVGNREADALAAKIPGLDVVIVGGQGPQVISRGATAGTATVVSAGIRGQHAARALVTLEAGKVTAVTSESTPLDARYPEQDVYANLVKSFEDSLNARVAKRQREIDMVEARKRGVDHYLGREACVDCHKAAYDKWIGSPHARAFDTLVKRRKEIVADCVPCHVTGYRENGGYFSSQNPGIEINGQMRRMEGVQCEACHGMGTEHNTGDPAFVNGARASCTRCHNADQSPKFNYAKYWARIAH